MVFFFSTGNFYNKYVCLPQAQDPTPSEIRNNPCFYPFFQDVIGALDGTQLQW